MWEVRYHPAAEAELGKLPAAEQAAIRHAVEKLQAVGPDLGYPHSSQTKGIAGLRELRPRADWRGPAQHAGASTKTKAEAGR
jgi:hypothetical protein